MTGQENERGAPLYLYEKGERSMNYDPELAALLSQPWSEGACRGYVISAMSGAASSPPTLNRSCWSSTRFLTTPPRRRLRLTTSGAPIDFWTKCPEVTPSSGQRPMRVLAVSFIHTVLRGRYFMQAQVKYESEIKTAVLGDRTITVKNVTPIYPPQERDKRSREVERRLFDVFVKYAGQRG